MRRAAILAFRTARRSHGRKALSPRVAFSFSSRHGPRPAFSLPPAQRNKQLQVLQASIAFRPIYLASAALIASGAAWFTLRDDHTATEVRPSSNSSSQTEHPLTPLSVPEASHMTNFSSALPDSPPKSTLEQAAESTRKALVVENDQFYSWDLVGDEPISKEVDDSGRMVLEMLTPEQATYRLRKNEESYLVGRGRGVVRYDVVQLASNNPIEDDHAEKIVEVPQTVAKASSDWMFWGVFDGHSGWTTSAKLRQALISFVARELNTTYMSASTDPAILLPTPESIDAAIKKGFLRLDHEICVESVEKVLKAKSKPVGAEVLAPALSGSCALLSFYDSRSNLLRVACTGDSRAVLGRRGASGKWIATPLSEDQTGGTPSEDARLRAEHPGEQYVTHKGRILGGLEPSRAFGDAVYKWSLETQQKIRKSYFGKTPSALLKTPPYVTAEPVITTTKVDPSKGDFVVMATDGLWECLTNEEVVGLVGQWLETQGRSQNSWLGSWFSPGNAQLPVEKSADNTFGRKTVRVDQWGIDDNGNRFVVQDKNVATHLVRNALGGKDKDMVCALLTLPSPYSRRYR